ncbi:MAG TPA: HAD family hydrolase [Roseiflexaceae bacterium]|nr:HAD family hydrolase [Roseiflexaceae bacterium]
MSRLILWDIDGTLVYTVVAGAAMRAAMGRVFGPVPEQERHAYAGKTDQQIILETFAERHHDDLLGDLERFTAIYLEELEQRRAAILDLGRVLDGVRPALERLTGAGVVQSVLTGNLKPVARFKLDLMGLTGFFDLESGAYGSDHHHRVELVPIAAARAAQRHGHQFRGHEIVVIGDTPNDIACGKAAGARTVAVASGPFSLDQLRAHQPDAALPDLADTDAALRAILG